MTFDEALRQALLEVAAAGGSASIPGLGRFSALKEEERITHDLASGGEVLLPPRLSLVFEAAGRLRAVVNKPAPDDHDA